MQRMRKNNLEIRIAGSSWRPQLDVQSVKWIFVQVEHHFTLLFRKKKDMVYKIFPKRNGQ